MKLKVITFLAKLKAGSMSNLGLLCFIAFLTSCVPTGPGGGDIEIETAESVDPELVNASATALAWGSETVETSVSYASSAKALWTPSSDAPFFSRQQVKFYSDTNCTLSIGAWRNVPAGKNEMWIDGLTQPSTISYRVRTYTDINERLSSCSPSISVDLVTQKAPIITSTCDVTLSQGENLNCLIQYTDLNKQVPTFSLINDTCGAGNLNINAATGLLTWSTDDDDFSAVGCSADVVVTDTDADTDTQSLNFVLTNAAPTLDIVDQVILENSGAQVLLTDTEVAASDEGFGVYAIDGGSSNCDPALGTMGAINTSTGELSFTPSANINGNCSITVTFDDQNAANNTVSKTISLSVQSTNVAPTLSDNCPTALNEGDPFSCAISSTDADGGDTLAYALSAANTCAWADVNAATGAVNTIGAVNLNNSNVGTCTLGLQVGDGETTVTSTKTITITNTAPTYVLSNETSTSNLRPYTSIVIKNDAGSEASDEPYGVYSILAATTAPDCAVYSQTLSIDATQGTISMRPNDDFISGGCFIRVSFDDGNGASVVDQFLLTFNSDNLVAVIEEPNPGVSCEASVSQDEEFNCDLQVNNLSNLDADPITWETAPTHDCAWITSADIDANGDINKTPTDDDVGACTLAIRVWDTEDSGVKSYSNTFTKAITVNNIAPTFTAITTSFTINEDPNPSIVSLFTDGELQTSDEGFGTYTIAAPDTGTYCEDDGDFTFNTTTGVTTFDPDTNFSSDCGFKITFDDGNGGSIFQNIAVTFIEDPDAPIITASCLTTTTEDVAYNCVLGITDPDFNDTHVWTLASTNTNPSCNWLSFADNSVGTLTGTPSDNNVGTCDVRVFATDSFNQISNILDWTIVVNNVLPDIPALVDEPVAAGTFLEDTGNILIKQDTDVQSIDEGFGDYSLDLVAVSQPGCHEFGTLEADRLTGAIRFQPATNWSGTCNVKIDFDDFNAVNNQDSEEFAVIISEVQDPPNVNISHCRTQLIQDNTYYCKPRISDPDIADTVTLNIVSNDCAAIFQKGADEDIENINLRPNDDDGGICNLVIEAEDNNGNKSVQKTLTILIKNQLPIIDISKSPNDITINEDAPINTVILTDAEVESIDEGYGTYSLSTPSMSPSCQDVFSTGNLTIDANTGEVIGNPNQDYFGECYLKILFNDYNNPDGVAEREVKVRVLPVSDAPVITEACPVTIDQDIAYNCDFDFTDIELNEFHTFQLAGDNTCSWATINALDGVVRGSPSNLDMNPGTCVLSVDILDGRTSPPTNRKVTITLNNEDPSFTLALTDMSIKEDADFAIIKPHPLVTTTEEGDGGTYSLTVVSNPSCLTVANPLVIDSATGQIEYEPADDFTGDCFINVHFDDGNGATTDSEFTVTVSPLVDPMSITSTCSSTINENTAFNCTATIDDPDSAGDISYSFASGHTCSWLNINPSTGDMSGTPNDNNVGGCTLAYQASDGIRLTPVKKESVTVSNIQPSFPATGAINVDDNISNFMAYDFTVNNNHEGFGQYSISPTTPTAPNCLDQNTVFIDPNSGHLFFTPSPAFTPGNCFLTIVFDDHNSPTNTGSTEITVTVVDADDPPVLGSSSVCPDAVTEGATYDCTIDFSDEETANADINGTHTFNLHPTHTCGAIEGGFPTSPTVGAALSNIQFQIIPTNIQSNMKICTIAFTVTENGLGETSDVFTKSIQVVNSRPTFDTANLPGAFTESDGPYTIFNDADIETDDEAEEKAGIPALISEHYGKYSLIAFGSNRCGEGVAGGELTIDQDTGATTFDPDETNGDFTGNCNIYIEYHDGTNAENTIELIVPVTVNPTRDPPTITGNTCANAATEDSSYNCSFVHTDPDENETYTWSLVGNTCTWLSIDPSTGTLSGTPTNADVIATPNCTFQATVNDGSGAVSDAAFNIAISNTVPSLPPTISKTIKLSTAADIVLGDYEVQNDDEGSAGSSYTIVNSLIMGTANVCTEVTPLLDANTGALTVSSTANAEICDVNIQFNDGAGGITLSTLRINSAPGGFDIPSIDSPCAGETLNQGVALTSCTAGSQTAISPLLGFTFAFQIDSNLSTCPIDSTPGSVDHGLYINSATGDIDGQFNNEDVGTCDLIYFAQSTAPTTSRSTIRRKITYTITNVTPTLTLSAPFNTPILEDAAITVLINDDDFNFDDESTLSDARGRYSLIAPGAGTPCTDIGDLQISPTRGGMTFEPNQDVNGTCEIRVQFDDGNGATVNTDFSLVITAQNDDPNIPGLPTENQSCRSSILQGNPYSCTLEHQDPDTAPAIVWGFGVGHNCGVWLSIGAASGVLSGTPANGDVTTCLVSVTVTDGGGTDDTFQYNLTVVNTSPEITITSVNSITEDDPLTVVVSDANISNLEEGLGGTYSLNSDEALIPKCADNGTMSINATNGEISFLPGVNFDGECFARAEFDDGNSPEPSFINFIVDVTPVNDAPEVTTACNRRVTEGDDFVCYLKGVNPEEEEQLAWSITNDCGWVKLHNSGVLYGTPNQADVGTCEVAVSLQDESLTTNETVYIEVQNAAPTLTILDKHFLYSTGTMQVATDFDIEASQEGESGTSYRLAHEQTNTPRCYDIANPMTIAANGSISLIIPEDRLQTQCNIAIEFDDGIEKVTEEFSVTFLSEDKIPSLTSSCLTEITQNDNYTCFPHSESQDKTGVTWSMHPSNTCDWLSINATSGFITGTPENDDVGVCQLNFYSDDGDYNSEINRYDINVSNASPSFVIPSGGNRNIKSRTGGEALFHDLDIQSPDEGSGGFYFIPPSVSSAQDCRLSGEVIVDGDTGAVIIAPKKYFSGACTFDLGFFDLHSSLNTHSSTVNVNVDGTNSAPTLTATCDPTAAIDTVYTCTPTTFDLDDDTISLSLSEAHNCNWLVVSGDDITGTPTSNDTGTCLLGMYATDSIGRSSYYEVDITIPNVAPTLSGNFSTTINEDAGFDIVFADSDIESTKEGGNGRYFWQSADPSGGESDCRSSGNYLLDRITGEIRYQPEENKVSACSFKVGFDDLGDSDNIVSQTLTISFSQTDDPPEIVANCDETINQDTNYSCTLSHIDTDSGSLAVWEKTDRDNCHWLDINVNNGALNGQPDNNDVGTCFLSVVVKTGSPTLTSLPYELNISTIDFVSSFTLPFRQVSEDSNVAQLYSNLEVNAQEEGKGFYYLSDQISSGTQCSDLGLLTLDSQDGTTTFVPYPDMSGLCKVRIGFQENNAPGARFEAEAEVDVFAVNDAPTLEYSCKKVISQDQSFTCQPIFFDPDNDVAASFQANANTCSWLSIHTGTGVITGTPYNNDIQPCSIRVLASDGNLSSNEHTINIQVLNNPPVLDINDTFIAKNSSFSILRSDQDVQASEEGFGSYTLTNTATLPSCSSKGTLGINSVNGEITYAPDFNFVGICFVNVSFNDGFGGIASSEFKVTVNNLNAKPSITESCSRAATEGTAYNCNPAVVDDMFPGFSYSWSLAPFNKCTFLTINPATGALSGTPLNEHVGSCVAAFSVNDGEFDSNIINYTINITNTAPTLSIADVTIAEEAAMANIRSDAQVQSSDETTGPEIGMYTFGNASHSPDCRNHGSETIDLRNGTVGFAPETNFQGDCYFKVRFDDEHGSLVEDNFKVSVTNSDDAPVITSDCSAQTIQQDATYQCTISVTEFDNDTISSYTTAGCTWATVDLATGVVTLSPTDDNVGNCSLSITAKDSNNTDSNTLGPYAMVIENIQPSLVISPPTVAEQANTITLLTDGAVTSSEEGFGTYSFINQTTGLDCRTIATVSINPTTGTVSFNPDDENFSGTCYLNIEFDDGQLKANSKTSAIVRATIVNISDPPTIAYASCSASATERVPYSCLPSSFTDPDLEFGPETLTATFGPAHTCNWLEISEETGNMLGTPKDNNVETCVVDVTLTDSNGLTDQAAYSITVGNTAPTLSIDHAIMDEGVSTQTVIRSDAQVQASDEGSGGTYSIISATPSECQNLGNVTVHPTNGQVAYTPTAPMAADCNISIRFTDTQGLTASDEFTLFLLEIDDPPVLNAACTGDLNQGTPYSCATPPNATDDGNSTISFMAGLTHTCHWLTIDSASGAVTGTPGDDNIGACTLDIRAFDGAFFSNSYVQPVSVTNVQPTLVLPVIPDFVEDDPNITNPLDDSQVQASEEGDGVYYLDPDNTTSPACSDYGSVTINTVNGAISFDAPSDFNGSCFVKVVFDDENLVDNLVTDEVQLTVTAVNDVPAIDLTACPLTPNEGEAFTCRPIVSDPDNENLVFNLTGGTSCGSWLSISPGSGFLSGTPTDDDFGPCNIEVTVTDGVAAFDTQTLALNIQNVAPVISFSNITVPKALGNITILGDSQVESSDEGFGIYSIDNSAVTGVNCGDNSSGLAINPVSGSVTLDFNDSFEGNCDIGINFDDQNPGGSISRVITVSVSTNVSLLTPVLTTNNNLIIDQGVQNFVITRNLLDARDLNSSDSNISFELMSLPQSGTFKINGTSLGLNESFTLLNVDSGIVTYSHDNTYGDNDLASIRIKDEITTGETFNFNITVVDRRRADGQKDSQVFATNGESMVDLSSEEQNFYDSGYQGDPPLFNQTADSVYGGYISMPVGAGNHKLEVALGTDADFSTSDFSIDFYIKSEATGESFVMATKDYNFTLPGGDDKAGWGIKISNTGTVRFESHNTGSITQESTQVVNDDKWHLVSINKLAANITMYVDGVLQGTSIVGAHDFQTEDILIIGSGNEAEGLPNGVKAIDEIRIYKGRSLNSDNHFAYTCPENFVMVPGSMVSGHSNPFCLAKYEMKELNISTPISKPDGAPWNTVTQAQAITFCQNMGTGFELITNPQWMTTAHNIESQNANWSNNVIVNPTGTTKLSRGNAVSGLAPEEASTDDSEFCHNVSSCSEAGSWSLYKRTFVLSNGEVIWDMAGNANEHVNFSLNSDKPDGNLIDDPDFDVNDSVETGSLRDIAYKPLSSAPTNEDNAIGSYYPGDENVGGTMLRGGDTYLHGVIEKSGLFNLDLRNGSSQQAGFRCIFLN